MQLTRIQLRILASFGVALIVLATGWVAAGALTSALGLRAQAQASRRIADAANDLQLQVLQAESAERGYLVTMDDAYLRAYEAAMGRPDPMAALRAQFAGRPEMQAMLERLATSYREKREEMAEVLDAARQDGRDPAMRRVAEGRGLRLGDAIRMDLDDLLRRERLLRDEFSGRVASHMQFSRAVVLSGTLLAFSLAVLVNVSLMGAIRAREEAQRVVEAQSATLSQQTESLLRHERQLGEQLVRQQELSDALQRSNDELDQFAYATSHDLKAPLRGIVNLATFVEEDLGDQAPETVRDNLRLLRGRASRLDALIEGILAYSRAGRSRSDVERVDTGALAREVVDLISPPSTCRIAVAEDLPTMLTERVPLQQVFMNLLQNAVKHGCPEQTGMIEIGIDKTGGRPIFFVQDHGQGIAPQHHERIFGVFQTLAPRDKVEGTGIGLAVVKKLVETRGGKVEVASRIGEGCRFSFVWPAEVV